MNKRNPKCMLSFLQVEDRCTPSASLPLSTATPDSFTTRSEVAIIDSRVPGAATLAQQLYESGRFDGGAILIVDANADGLAAVGDLLRGRSDVTAVHLVTHGEPGKLLLGDAWIDLNGLSSRAEELADWRAALANGADLLVYGCDVGAGAAGISLANMFVSLTGMDVAESIDRTGIDEADANWVLELRTGNVETAMVSVGRWAGTLGTIPVTNTTDSGPGSLRQAILDANASPGVDTIAFSIPGGGPQVISPLSPLPTLTDRVVVDGTFQPGYAGIPLVGIDGSVAGAGATGLTLGIGASGSTVRGLAIYNFSRAGIVLDGSDSHTIVGNWIGTNLLGASGFGNGGDGLLLIGSSGNVIGGPSPIDANTIVGNSGSGIEIIGSNNRIRGNRIGIGPDGITANGNLAAGVSINGLLLAGSGNQVGGTVGGEGNVIANNLGAGVRMVGLLTLDNSVMGNSIFANGALGIDLNDDGNSPNDLLDLDLGANGTQNAPVLTVVSGTAGTTTISGTISTTILTTMRIEFFSNPPGTPLEPTGFGEGRVFLGSTTVTTNILGDASFTVTLPVGVPGDSRISATATVSSGLLTFLGSSEFSNALLLPAKIVVSPPSVLTTSEAGGSTQFTVVLGIAPTAPVTIPVSVSDTSEATASVTSLTFDSSNWNVPQTVTITGTNDSVVDGTQAYTVVLGLAISTDPAFDGIDPDDVDLSNLDDDLAGFTVTPTSVLTTTESGGVATFTVVLDSQPTATVTIPVTSSNTAEGTPDVGLLVFTPANWNIPQVVTVTGVDDAMADGPQSYQIVLAPVLSIDLGYSGFDPNDVAFTNMDNDTASFTVVPTGSTTTSEDGTTATFTVVLDSQPTATVTIPVTSSNTAEGTPDVSSLVFTPANWSIPQVVTVTGVDDAMADGPQSYQIVLAPVLSIDLGYSGLDPTDVTFTNTDNDTASFTVVPTGSTTTSEDGTTATFSVALSTQPTSLVVVAVLSSAPTEGQADVALLIFTPANWNTPQVVTVTGQDDLIADGAVGYTISLTVSLSLDLNYLNLLPTVINLTNADNDTAGVTVTPTSVLTTTESGGVATFTVVLDSQPTATVTIPVTSSNSAEGIPDVGLLVFTPANWNIPQVVTVTGVDDAMADGPQSYQIVLAPVLSIDLGYTGFDPNDVAFTNMDNDSAGVAINASSVMEVSEAGSQGTFSVRLLSQPLGGVTIPVESSNVGEGIVSVNAITFTPANWFTPQFVVLTGVDDLAVDGNVVFSVLIGPVQSVDAIFDGLILDALVAVNLDDDILPTPVETINPLVPVDPIESDPPTTGQPGDSVDTGITPPEENDSPTLFPPDSGGSGSLPPFVPDVLSPGPVSPPGSPVSILLDQPPVGREFLGPPPREIVELPPAIVPEPAAFPPILAGVSENVFERGPQPREIFLGVVDAEVPVPGSSAELENGQEKANKAINERARSGRLLFGTAAVGSLGLLLWGLRSLFWVLGAAASVTPTWKQFDPLVLLSTRGRRTADETDESLQSMVQ